VEKAVSVSSVDLAFDCKRFFLEVTASPYPGHIGKCLWSPATSSYKYMEGLEVGDCIIHYITADSKSTYKKTFIGISRVASKAKVYTKEELINKLKELNVWDPNYERFASTWIGDPHYNFFYFVGLSDFIEFERKVSLEEYEKHTGDSIRRHQSYISELSQDYAVKLLEIAGMKREADYIDLKRFKHILVIPGSYNNVLRSLCDALKRGVFLWGVREKSSAQFSIVKKIFEGEDRDFTLLMIYATELGVLALGVPHKILTEDRDKEFFNKYWCNEEEKVLYPYRFTIKLQYINKHVSELLQSICVDPCKVQPSVFSREKLVGRTEIEHYISGKGIRYRILTRNIARMKPEVVKYVIEFFENKIKEGVFEHVITVLEESSYRLEKLVKNVQTIKELVILLHLLSGKNVLLSGPPGSGKTSLLKNMLEKLKIKYMIETGNPDWTPFDTLGGFSIGSPENFRKGFIFEAAEQCRQALERGELYWLIIDEINRANVDLAFGKFFTLLDPTYRLKESLRVCSPGNVCIEVQVPLSFRVLATMNNYDRALLFKLGYALTRRFAVINHAFLENLLDRYMRKYENAIKEGVLEKILKISEKDYGESIGLNFEIIKEDLTLCRKDLRHDCVTPLDFKDYVLRLGDKWREDLYSIQTTIGVIRLDNVITYLVHAINENLREFVDCEVCPVEITPGVVADALKYIALGVYASKRGLVRLSQMSGISSPEHELSPYMLLLLDTAFSTYIIPQLDILADYASREKLQRGIVGPQQTSKENTASRALESIKELLASHGLIYSSSLVEKLSKGYHVY
jgi:hypothetical protein